MSFSLIKKLARLRQIALFPGHDLFEHAPVPMWIYDAQSYAFLRVNLAARRLYGYSAAEFSRMNLFEMREPLDRELLQVWKDEHPPRAIGELEHVGIWRHRRKDGSALDVDVTLRATRYAGRAATVSVLHPVDAPRRNGEVWRPAHPDLPLDAAERHDNQREHKRLERALWLQSQALEASLSGLLVTNPGGRIEYVNAAFTAITGYLEADVLGRHWRFLMRRGDGERGADSARVRSLRSALGASYPDMFTLELSRKDQQLRAVQLRIVPVKGDGPGARHQVMVINDVTELSRSQERLMRQANYDVLTQLPNRNFLHQRLGGMIAKARSASMQLAVLFIDLDHFKDVNDGLGHGVGDKLLSCLAARLPQCVGPDDLVARYGGDEFVALVHFDCEARLREILDAMQIAICDPVLIDGHELYVESSIGVSRFPSDGDDPVRLLKQADITMYEAKARGRNGYRFYRRELMERIDARLDISTRLRRAVKGNELFLHYQPQVNMVSGAIVGLEALVRWRDPLRGVVSPASFIPIAEESGLIVKVGEWVLRRACQQAAVWARAGHGLPGISVNLSPLQLQRSDVYGLVQAVLSETGMPPHLLELEVTESAIMENPDEASALFARLQQLGIRIAIDDFGTGYSSLSYLKTYQVDRIKIDRTFISDIGHDLGDNALTQAIIGLSHSLQCRVIAEGVETAAHRQFLISHGCEDAQGFYYSRPVDAAQITRMLEAGDGLMPGAGQLAEVL